jgi:peptide/nickel transport system permease protein
MFFFIFKRVIYFIPIIFGVTLFIFILFNIVAGDPTAVILGKYASQKQMADLRHSLGLDKSMFLQYIDLIKSVLKFDFGTSWKSKQKISTMLFQGALNSLTISLPTFIISNLVSISISLWVTTFKKIVDELVLFSCIVLTSISILAYVLFGQWILAFKLGIFEICGYERGFPNFIPYVLLPVLIGLILSLGHEIRYYRACILDEKKQDYIKTAISKGLPNKLILYKHILKNIRLNIISNCMNQFPTLIMGHLIIENFFGIPGFSNIVIQAIYNSDFPVIKSSCIVISVSCIIFNLFCDIISKILDPRVNLK